MLKRPRIGYVLKVYPRISQTFVLTEILAHERAGLDMDIFSLRRTDDTRFHAALARVQSPVFQISRASTKASPILDELREHAVALPQLWDVVRDSGACAEDLVQAARLSRAIIDRGIDHLHAHFGTVATVVARLASKITGVSYSFTAHAKDIFHEVVDEAELRQKLADAAGVITVSQFNVDYLKQKYDSAAERVKLIYNGLDLDEFRLEPEGERPPLILAVGRLIEKKGFSYLVEACALLREKGVKFRCEIVGGGELESDLRKLILECGVGDCVRLCGPMSQSDVKEKIRGARLLAAPCVHAQNDDRDGLPTILLEAMALGTPSISTPVTGIPEVLRPDSTGLMVAERDAGALAAACEKLLADRELADKLVHSARQLIDERFDIDKNTAEIRAFFAEIMTLQRYHGETIGDYRYECA
jgi:glycosyltransferase involved in cell wall biosynthesis